MAGVLAPVLAGVLAPVLAGVPLASLRAQTPAPQTPLPQTPAHQAPLPQAPLPEAPSAFGVPEPGADFETLSDFRLGNAAFRQHWTPAGEGPEHFDGLGPLFNAPSCESCHVRDGRGRPPQPGGAAYASVSMIVKLGRAGGDRTEPMRPDPVYGRQLQDFAVSRHRPEGRIAVSYDETVWTLAGGERVVLRRPTFAIADPAYGPLDPHTILAPRIAPAMIGLGLLARVPVADIMALADPRDLNGDAISGRANIVAYEAGSFALGRFGWKAGVATIERQIALALSRDMGLSNPDFPDGAGDCTTAERACRDAPNGNTPAFEDLEAHSTLVKWLARYSENLAVPPPRRRGDPAVLRGRAQFESLGCALCHRPRLTTAPDPDAPHLGGRTIAPYSDLLLHDMGDGLADGSADGFAEGLATGREWRTAPLWGIGLTAEVNGHLAFLHDGRARSLTEAIGWHGGEAAGARDRFAALDASARADLIAFLESL